MRMNRSFQNKDSKDIFECMSQYAEVNEYLETYIKNTIEKL